MSSAATLRCSLPGALHREYKRSTVAKPPAAQQMTSVLISGASIAGLTLATWLSRYGFVVTVVERNASELHVPWWS
jgi:hypothetical protein